MRSSSRNIDDCVYTLGQHAQYLQLSSEVVSQSGNRYWFCDWTPNFASLPHQNRLIKNVVKEYCQPFQQHDLEDQFVGISALSSMKRDPPAVRTVTIQLRPDCDHIKVYGALNEAFAVLHPKHHTVLKNSDNCFQAIGADGNTPLLLSAQLVTSKDRSALDRYLLLRFFHVDQVHLLEEDLQKIGGVNHKMTALREVQTPLNNKLGEACAMLQNLFRKADLVQMLEDEKQQLLKSATKQRKGRSSRISNTSGKESLVLHEMPSPMNSTRESSRYFMENLTSSPSVKDENWENLAVFPSLCDKDYDVLQETWPLLERIWSELEMAKCTFNTLIDEAWRFGMLPCQPTLDKDYCIQLFQVSQQRMLEDLRHELDRSEDDLHESLGEYSEFEQQLTHKMIRTYNIPLDKNDHNLFNRRDHTSDSLDVGQTPVSLPQRNVGEFPWEFEKITLALQDVTHTITCVCLEQDYDPTQHSLQVCERSVEHVFSALEDANDSDQQEFLKKRNRQSLIRVSQQKLYLKDLIYNKLPNAPRTWGGLPRLEDDVARWREIAAQSSNKDDARLRSNWGAGSGGGGVKKAFEVPLLEFKTKFGTGCVTQNTVVLLSEMPFFESVKGFEINKIEVVGTPNNPLHKVCIMRHGKRLLGFSPTEIDPEQVVKVVKILKSLHK